MRTHLVDFFKRVNREGDTFVAGLGGVGRHNPYKVEAVAVRTAAQAPEQLRCGLRLSDKKGGEAPFPAPYVGYSVLGDTQARKPDDAELQPPQP